MKYFETLLLMMLAANANSGELVGVSEIPIFGESSSFSEILGVELAKEDALKPVTKKYTVSENIDVTYAHRPQILEISVQRQEFEKCGEHICLKTKVKLVVGEDVNEDIRSRLRNLETSSLSDIVDQQIMALKSIKQKYRINTISKNINQALLNRWMSFSADEELELLKRVEHRDHFDGFNVDSKNLDVFEVDSNLIEGVLTKDNYQVFRVSNPSFAPSYTNLEMQLRYNKFRDTLRFNHHYSQTTFTNPINKAQTILWRARYDCLSYRNLTMLMSHKSALNVTMLHTQPEIDFEVNGKKLTVGRGYFDYENDIQKSSGILGLRGNQYPNAFCQFIHGEFIVKSPDLKSTSLGSYATLNYRVAMYDVPPNFRADTESLDHWVAVRDAYHRAYYQPKFDREARDYANRCSDGGCSDLYFNFDIKDKMFNVSPKIKLPIDGKRGLYPMRIENFTPTQVRQVTSSRPWFIEDCINLSCGFEKGENH